jgi:hypothetical protein
VESRKDELTAKIRERRARLERTLSTLDDRFADIGEVKDKVVKVGRLAVMVIAVSTVTLASLLVMRALARALSPRRAVRGRWPSGRRLALIIVDDGDR